MMKRAFLFALLLAATPASAADKLILVCNGEYHSLSYQTPEDGDIWIIDLDNKTVTTGTHTLSIVSSDDIFIAFEGLVAPQDKMSGRFNRITGELREGEISDINGVHNESSGFSGICKPQRPLF